MIANKKMMNSKKPNSVFFQALCFLLLASTLAACSSFPSTNQDPAKNNKATYDKDLKECQEDYPQAGSGVHIRQWINCMKLKGWK